MGSQFLDAKGRRFVAAIEQAYPSDLYPTVRRRTRAARRWRPYQTDDRGWRMDNYRKREAMQRAYRRVLEHRQRLTDAAIRDEVSRKREEEQARYVEMVRQMQPSAVVVPEPRPLSWWHWKPFGDLELSWSFLFVVSN